MKIPYGKQSIDQCDIDAVIKVLKSDFLTQGPNVLNFEKAFAEYVGASYAVAVCNATVGLHIGYKALKKSNKKVITTPNTFAASANCVRFENDEVEFVDIDPKNFNIDLDKIETLLEKESQDYQGIIPVDFAGLPVDTERLRSIANKYGLWIMEDACHALGGGFYNSNKQFIKCGSSIYSDITVFSFHPVKHLATGEGGMLTTNDEKTYQHLLKLRSHGIEKDHSLLIEKAHGGWYHEMQELGYNYRMPDLNAALGLSQLKKLPINISRRQEIAKKYKQALKIKNIKFQEYDEEKYLNAYHLFVIQVKNRKEIYDHLKERNIFSQVHYIPVYKHPYYQNTGFKNFHAECAEAYYEQALSLPMFHGLTNEEQDYIISHL